MPYRLITPPAGEPISVEEAKDHLRLDTAEDDVYVTALITAARQYTEQVCWRAMLTQTNELVLPGFIGQDRFELYSPQRFSPPAGFGYAWGFERSYRYTDYIELPFGQVGALASDAVKYTDENGVIQTLASSEFSVDDVSVPGRLRLAYGKCWPTTRNQWDAVRITYPVGWDDATLPNALKQAMLLLISQMYEHRTPEVAGIISMVQFTYDALLGPYRLFRL